MWRLFHQPLPPKSMLLMGQFYQSPTEPSA